MASRRLPREPVYGWSSTFSTGVILPTIVPFFTLRAARLLLPWNRQLRPWRCSFSLGLCGASWLLIAKTAVSNENTSCLVGGTVNDGFVDFSSLILVHYKSCTDNTISSVSVYLSGRSPREAISEDAASSDCYRCQ